MTITDILELSVPECAAYLETLHGITPKSPELDPTHKDRMLATKTYDWLDPLLVQKRQRGYDISVLFNAMDDTDAKGLKWQHHPQQGKESLERNLARNQHRRDAWVHLLTDGNSHQSDHDAFKKRRASSSPSSSNENPISPRIEPVLQIAYGCHLTLGSDRCVLGPNFLALDCSRIRIGSRTRIGPGCRLFGATHPLNPFLRHPDFNVDFALPITIGEDCWIGGGTIICPGVEIGRGVTVLEGSVVTKNVLPFTVVGGAPATIIEVLDEEDCKNEFNAFQSLLEAAKLASRGAESEASLATRTWDDWSNNWTPPPRETMTFP